MQSIETRATRQRRGFGLVEALVVIAIAAIVTAATLPAYQAMQQRARLRAAVDALRGDFGEARSLARARGQPVYVSFARNADGRSWCWGLSVARSCDCTDTATTGAQPCVLTTQATPVWRIATAGQYPQVMLDALPFGGALRFNPRRDGLLAGSATFSAGGQSLRVVASSLGRLRLCSPSGKAHVSGVPTC